MEMSDTAKKICAHVVVLLINLPPQQFWLQFECCKYHHIFTSKPFITF